MKSEKNQSLHQHFHFVLGGAAVFVLGSILSACFPAEQNVAPSKSTGIGVNFVEASPSASQSYNNGMRVMGSEVLDRGLDLNIFVSPVTPSATLSLEALVQITGIADDLHPPPAADGTGLLLAIPLDLLNQQNVFGGVITQVSDTQDESLGDLKLTDLSALNVKDVIGKTVSGKYVLSLQGCADRCGEDSPPVSLVSFPVLGLDQSNGKVIVDLSAVGQGLDLVKRLDPTGENSGLKTRSAKTVSYDYSLATLVFDVESQMIPKDADPADASIPSTLITSRWYLKLGSVFNPSFQPRNPVPEVGFFTTNLAADTKITRFSYNSSVDGQAPVHYFVKNVPNRFQPAFQAAFDEWNSKLEPLLGKRLLSYEFIAVDDPRAKVLVPGDVRYNILEWDLVNRASYGGLGPSIANQATGETFSANVLIQGPAILEIYTKWFGVQDRPDSELLQVRRELEARFLGHRLPPVDVSVGHGLKMRVVSQLPSLEDPLMSRDDFETIPTGSTFDTYMFGYFREMVSHELGHNLGLRHNFRGNLGAAQVPGEGTVSRSVMEYLSRLHRQMDHISPYDVMAISYGYKGVTPEHKDWFCTDEDSAKATDPTKSAECSSSDLGNDPFSFFEARLGKVIDLMIARKQATASSWTIDDVKSPLGVAVNGLALYAYSAVATSQGWTNFARADRPTSPVAIRKYVVQQIKAQICDEAGFAAVLEGKESDEVRTQTQANIDAVRIQVEKVLSGYEFFTSSELSCMATLAHS